MNSYYQMRPSISQDYNDFGTDEGEAKRLQFPTALECGAEGTDFEETDLSILDSLPELTGVGVLGSTHLKAAPVVALDGLELV